MTYFTKVSNSSVVNHLEVNNAPLFVVDVVAVYDANVLNDGYSCKLFSYLSTAEWKIAK